MEFTRDTFNCWFPQQVEPIYDEQDKTSVEEFISYWENEKDRCINGFYLADGQVFIPGRLYFHTVYGKIAAYQVRKLPNGKEAKTRSIITPLLRDLEWIIFNDIEKCTQDGLFYSLVGSRDFGKALINCATIYTNNGPKEIGDARIGDRIFGADGELTTITGVYPQGKVPLYKMTLRDGRVLYCCDEHLWTVWDQKKKKYVTLPLKEIRKDYLSKRKVSYKNSKGIEANYFIPNNAPVQYTENYLPVDPYFLGLWLGDGSSRLPQITTVDTEISDYVYEYARKSELQVNTYGISHAITTGKRGGTPYNSIRVKMQEMDLFMNKHIPDCYIHSSVEQRMELLKGLMDTDGSCDKRGVIEYCTSDSKIASGFYQLVRSLGIQVTCKKSLGSYKKNGIKTTTKTRYRFNLMTSLPIFKLERKLKNIKTYRDKKTAIVDINYYGEDYATCITVDNKDQLFLTDNYTVTHNSVIAASCAAWQYTFFPKSEAVISGGESNYIKLATDKIEDTLTNIHPIFRKQRLTSDWKKEIVAGYKDRTTQLAHEDSHFASIKVRNYENGVKSMAANGTRPGFHLIDEIGTIQYLISCLKDSDGCWWSGGGIKPSCLVMIAGTGGNAEKGAEAAEVFFKPESYNFLEFDNPEEPGTKMGRFISALQVKMAFKEEQTLADYLGIDHQDLRNITILVSNEAKAKAEWWDVEFEKAKKSGNSKTLLGFKAYWPVNPSDCFLTLSKNIFDTEAASVQKKLLTADAKGFPVRIFNDGDGLKHEFVNKLPISEFPLKSQDPDAPIIMYEPPIRNAPKGLYVIGIDPYTHDESEQSDSLGSAYVFKRIHSLSGEKFQDMFVASYTARPESQREWWDNVRNLTKYYNAIAVVENDQPSYIHYVISKREEMYLFETPRSLQSDVQQSSATYKRPYGISMAPLKIRTFVFEMLKDYLNEEIVTERAEDGTPLKEIKGVQKILDPMLLEEIMKFNIGVNTDRVIAAALAIAVASKLDPIYGVIGGEDSRVKELYSHRPHKGIFAQNKQTFNNKKKLFR